MSRIDYEKYDLRLVKTQGVAFILLIGIGLAMVYFGWVYYESSKASGVAIKRQLIEVTSEKRKADQLVSMIDSYESQYGSLVENKYFESDLKLRWLESFGQIAEQLSLLGVDYNIGALATNLDESARFDGEIEVASMPVTIRLGLLHEGDLLAFEKALEKSGLGLYENNGCEVTRENEELDLGSLEPNFQSFCNYIAYQISIASKGRTP